VVARKKAAALIFVIAFCIFGYSQYALASKIGVEITKSNIVDEDEREKRHNIELKFQNPSLLVLTAGETDFFVIADEKTIGQGKLQPFVLPPIGDGMTQGTFVTSSDSDLESPVVKITGSTKYNVGFAAIDVPFVYYPTEEQAREFIQHN
jgi:hypothetical protein